MWNYEANLFAVALLCNEDEFNMPLAKMSNAVLKSILDCNVSYGQGEKVGTWKKFYYLGRNRQIPCL